MVNVDSFQLSAVLAYQSFQYAAWYTSTGMAVLGRRTLPSGAWSTLTLPHNLSTIDSHNVISLGVSPADGKIHVALDCHSTQLFYTVSEANLATSGNSWVASRFGAITTTLGTLNIGTCVIFHDFSRCLIVSQSHYLPSVSWLRCLRRRLTNNNVDSSSHPIITSNSSSGRAYLEMELLSSRSIVQVAPF